MNSIFWDIVEAATNRSTLEDDGIAFKDWSMKNALAIYLILASFGSKADTLIGKISRPKLLGILWQKSTSLKVRSSNDFLIRTLKQKGSNTSRII
jgi:hypothetical protein